MTRQHTKVKKVFVGLSGGVDSAVSAALLLRDGYDVTGVFIKVWQPDWISCTWKEERRSAMRVAAHLGIPFVTLDLVDEYKRDVIDYMIQEYSVGRTPNPDVMCNRYVKFGGFWKWAREHGADYVATGHYAQVINDEKSGFSMLAGVDKNKDQSYFLWTLNQYDLSHVLFPVGHLEKSEVRKLAVKFKLPNAEKKDSQGLCFIGKVDVKEFLSHYIETKPGDVLNERGEIIGEHPGSLLFTIGERHGFTLIRKTPNDAPVYVISKDVERNTITVSSRGAGAGSDTLVQISNASWVGSRGLTSRGDNIQRSDLYNLKARCRYRQSLQDIKLVSIDCESNQAVFQFKNPQNALTPGQSLVIYDGEKCLGGGIIA